MDTLAEGIIPTFDIKEDGAYPATYSEDRRQEILHFLPADIQE